MSRVMLGPSLDHRGERGQGQMYIYVLRTMWNDCLSQLFLYSLFMHGESRKRWDLVALKRGIDY